MFLRALIIFAVLLIIDFYVFQGFKLLFPPKPTGRNLWYIIYWCIPLIAFLFILAAATTRWELWYRPLKIYPFAIIAVIYISKLFVVVFLLLDDVIRVVRFVYEFITDRISAKPEVAVTLPNISRIKFLTQVGTVIAGVQFVSLLYGMARGAYDIRVRKVALTFPDLPEGLDGVKIIQISDVHSGSFGGTKHLENAVSIALDQGADVIFHTGDLVNDRSHEAEEFGKIFERLKAPMGVYSILGNHDYGDYVRWNSMEDKRQNLKELINLQHQFGWKMLNNSHTYLERNGSRIGLIGVENWSRNMRFKKYGKMNDAVENFEKQPFNILLSHDPSHWNGEITSGYPYIDLTLSGHTHGMQFGIDIPGFRWSPVKYVYKEWLDLYEKNSQRLYVNRGLGFIGYPGRVGILPEITVFELRRKAA